MPPQAIRGPKAQQQKFDTILTAGIKLFDKQGFGRTTMDEIAQAAGVTKRTLYRYVSSKPELLSLIHEQFLDAAEAQFPGEDGTPTDRLVGFTRAYLTVILKRQQAVRVFFEEEYHLSSESRARVVSRRDAFERKVRGLLAAGRRTGEFRDFDVQTAGAGIFGALAGAYRWYKPSGAMSKTRVVNAITELVLHGINRAAASSDDASPVEPVPPAGAIGSDTVPQDILDAAVELFATWGYSETSTQDIADAAGVTKSALFYHIGSKEDLLYEIHLAFAHRVLADLKRWRAAGRTPPAQLESVVLNHAVVMGAYRSWVRVFTDHDRHLRPEQRRAVESLRARYVAGVAEIIANGIADGSFRDFDDRIQALVVIGMLNWMARWFDPHGRLDAEAVGREFVRLASHGVVSGRPAR